jgi:hypothetical protein
MKSSTLAAITTSMMSGIPLPFIALAQNVTPQEEIIVVIGVAL